MLLVIEKYISEVMAKSELLGKIPPQNIEAEAAVLGAILVNREAMDKIADLVGDKDFYRQDHQIIFRAILRLYDKRAPIDLVTLTNELESLKQLDQVGGAAYLATLVNSVPTAIYVTHYAEIVRQKAVLRRILAAGQKISQLGYEEDREVQQILDEAEKAVFEVSHELVKDNFMPISDILASSFDRIDRLHREKGLLRGVTTGFKQLDNQLSGLQNSDLIILAARPSMGKTTLALNLALNAATKGKTPTGFFSLEQSKEQIVDKLICAQAMVDGWKLRTGNLSEDDFPAIGMAMGTLAEAPIFIDDSPGLTVLEIRTRARRLKAEHNLGLIVVDYLQLIDGGASGNVDNRVQQVSEISRNLKGIARELDVPVLALSQLSRAVESRDKKIPQLSDLRESGCLTGDTEIIRADTGEAYMIRDLANRQVQKPMPVFTLTEDSKLVIKPMTKVFYSGRKKVYVLKTYSGRLIKASANHPFRKVEGWARLDSLKVGDKIALPRQLKVPNKKSILSRDELILLAHLLGDGCILPKQPFHYTSADKKNIEIVKQTASNLFGINSRVVRQKNWEHLYLTSPVRLSRNQRHPINVWYEGLGTGLARRNERQIPQDVFSSTNNDIGLFLSHLWATDGNISWKRTGGNRSIGGAIYYATTSQALARQVQHLLLRLGIISTLRQAPQKSTKYRTCFHVHIQGAQQQLKFLNEVGCFGERGNIIPEMRLALLAIRTNPNNDVIPMGVWKSLVEPAKAAVGMGWRQVAKGLDVSYGGSSMFKNGIGRERAMRLANITANSQLACLANSDIYWDEIVSVEARGFEDVYDATVPGTHNFVANDIVVHNSIEQDADIVMFLYREDYYDRETERKNITDLLIRKHRNGPIGEVELHFRPEQSRFFDLERKAKPTQPPRP